MILSQLPPPTNKHAISTPEKPVASSRALTNVGTALKEPPPYGTAERREYRPRRQEDFGDGGELCKVRNLQPWLGQLRASCYLRSQYSLNMPSTRSSTGVQTSHHCSPTWKKDRYFHQNMRSIWLGMGSDRDEGWICSLQVVKWETGTCRCLPRGQAASIPSGHGKRG